ncbi:MAG TPA: hypothetical protein VM223_01220 [Planctomycetota bacterium]|nr:hypothetical protein [Planctomycetota bacterium]
MKSLLDPVELNRETTQALDEIRSGADNPLYGTASAVAEEKIYHSVLPLIEGAGLPNHYVMHYRWFLREVARLWRTRQGRDLAFHLELCIRKWINLGLESRTLQFLVSEAHQRLKASQPPTANSLPPAAKSAESAKSADVLATPAAESHPYAGDHKPVQDSDWMEGLA